MRALTLEYAFELAEHLIPPHRADILREYVSVWSWARSRVGSGVAWACLVGEQVFYGVGVMDNGQTWLAAGRDGWADYIKHAVKVARAVLESGYRPSYYCEVDPADRTAQRFAEYLGFKPIGTKDGFINYRVTP